MERDSQLTLPRPGRRRPTRHGWYGARPGIRHGHHPGWYRDRV